MSGGDDSGGPLAERRCGLNEGRVTALEPRSGANTTPTTLEEFAATVFAPAFGAS